MAAGDPSPPGDRRDPSAAAATRRGGRRITDLATHDQPHITVRQFADYMNVSDKTVLRKWIRTGKLRAVYVDGIWRICVRDAEAFVERHFYNESPQA